MGQIKKILFTKEIKPTCDYYNDKMSCETNENLHIHWKNIRLEFGKRDWRVFCDSIKLAFKEWIGIGKPKFDGKLDTIYLPTPQDINPISEFYPQRFQIEEQANVPTIHLHYRELRLEFSIPEFKEFAEGIKEALEGLK